MPAKKAAEPKNVATTGLMSFGINNGANVLFDMEEWNLLKATLCNAVPKDTDVSETIFAHEYRNQERLVYTRYELERSMVLATTAAKIMYDLKWQKPSERVGEKQNWEVSVLLSKFLIVFNLVNQREGCLEIEHLPSRDFYHDHPAGTYLIGDVLTYADVPNIPHEEGNHKLEDGTWVTLFKLPPNLNYTVHIDEDPYVCPSGYLGVIRQDNVGKDCDLPYFHQHRAKESFCARTIIDPFTCDRQYAIAGLYITYQKYEK